MFLKVRDSDNVIVEARNTTAFADEDGFTMIEDKKVDVVASGTYADETYTPPVVDTAKSDNWQTAVGDFHTNGDKAALSKPLQRKLSQNNQRALSDAEWTELDAEFGA